MPTHILAINDDQAILDLYTLALEGEGYTVSTSLMATQDVKEIVDPMPNLILLDFKMGKHNVGILLLEQLKLYRPTKDIPVLICTAALKDVGEQEDVLLPFVLWFVSEWNGFAHAEKPIGKMIDRRM